MSIWFSSGIVAYQLNIGLMAWILGLLWKRGTWREHPLFSAYTLVRFIRAMILFPLFMGLGMEAYSRGYWLFDPLLLASEFLAVAELWKRPKWGVLPAVGVFIVQLCLAIPRNNRAVDVEFYAMVAVAMACAPLAYKSLLALGFLITSAGTALTMNLPWLLNADESRYIPTYVFVVANFVWLGWALRNTTAESQR